jgi:hypothetical protein
MAVSEGVDLLDVPRTELTMLGDLVIGGVVEAMEIGEALDDVARAHVLAYGGDPPDGSFGKRVERAATRQGCPRRAVRGSAPRSRSWRQASPGR